jgi:hypothetical protein
VVPSAPAGRPQRATPARRARTPGGPLLVVVTHGNPRLLFAGDLRYKPPDDRDRGAEGPHAEHAGLRERREQFAELDRLVDIVDEYLRNLPHLVHGGQTSIGEEDRAERYRWSYGLLGLRVVAHEDGTLDVSGTFGGRVLFPVDSARWNSRHPLTKPARCPV